MLGNIYKHFKLIYILLSFFVFFSLTILGVRNWMLITIFFVSTFTVISGLGFLNRQSKKDLVIFFKKYCHCNPILLLILTAIFFTFSFSISEIFFANNYVSFDFQRIFTFLCLTLWFIPLEIVILLKLELSSSENLAKRVKPSSDQIKIQWLICFFTMFTVWTVYLLIFDYGGLSTDSFDVISQVKGLTAMNTGHPIAYIYMQKILWAIYPSPRWLIIFQISTFSLIITSILNYIYRQGFSKKIINYFTLIMALWPANCWIITTLWKDVYFTEGILLVTFSIALLTYKPIKFFLSWSNIVICITGLLLIGLTRYNGLIPLILSILTIILFSITKISSTDKYKISRFWLKLFLIFFVPASLFILFNYYLPSKININNVSGHAKNVTLVHGIASLIKTNESIPEDVLKTALEIAPLNIWVDNYQSHSISNYHYGPANSYNIFYQYDKIPFNFIVGQYLRSFILSPTQIIKSRLQLTSINWEFATPRESFIYRYTGDYLPQNELGIKRSQNPIQELIVNCQRGVEIFDIIFWRVGLYIILGMIIIVFLSANRSSDSMLMFMPSFTALAFLMIIGFSQDFRYVWFVHITTWFYIIWSLTLATAKDNHDKKN